MKTGTKEWCDRSDFNIQLGCANDCLYCYAKANAIRFNQCKPDEWQLEKLRTEFGLAHFNRKYELKDTVVMYPSSHDITPKFLDMHVRNIERILWLGYKLLIVSKPESNCIREILRSNIVQYFRKRIEFRFTIGSRRDDILTFWEPNAPSYLTRILTFGKIMDESIKVSVSIEPILEISLESLCEHIDFFVKEKADSIWIGTARNLLSRLSLNGYKNNTEVMQRAKELIAAWPPEKILELYDIYKDNPKIKWKDSIRKIIEEVG